MVYLILVGVPSHIHKQLDGIFHWLQVAYIQDPQLLNAAIVGQLQLFPHVLYRGNVDPLRIAGSTHVVYVVIQSPAALSLLLFGCRQSAHVTPVVVAEQHGHVIGHA